MLLPTILTFDCVLCPSSFYNGTKSYSIGFYLVFCVDVVLDDHIGYQFRLWGFRPCHKGALSHPCREASFESSFWMR